MILKKKLIVLNTTLMLGLGSVFAVPSIHAESIQSIEGERSGIQTEITEAQKLIDGLKAEQTKLTKQLNQIEEAVKENREKIDSTKDEIEQTKSDIEDLKKEIAVLEERIANREEVLKKRAVTFQENGGDVKYLEILFGSKDFSDLVDRVGAVASFAKADRDILLDQEKDKKDLEDKKASVEEKLDNLTNMKVELEGMQAQIEEQKAQSQTLKKELEKKEEETSSLIDSLEKKDSNLEAKIESIKEENRKKEEREAAEKAELQRIADEAAANESEGSEPDSEPAAKAETKSTSNTETKSASESKPEAKSQSESKPKTEAKSESKQSSGSSSASAKESKPAVKSASKKPVSSSKPSSANVSAAISAGYKYIGNSTYKFGGGRTASDIANGRFDCSGFVSWAYKQAGVNLTPQTDSMKNQGRTVPASQMKPGDLVFFDTYKKDGHVGIYVGGGKFIGSQSSTGVAIANMTSGYWGDAFNGRVVRVK
uniref:C40 family peptidase n=1 Tax=Bacillus massiliglaciei TaxID=1816693 RepID=UPI000DA6281E|nr:C40 family peptidase [Bacillus massiliglaciei]